MKKQHRSDDLPTKEEKALGLGIATALGIEHLAVIQLNRDLSQGLLKLVPKAIEQAAAKKSDTRLLRLLCRYSAATSRKFIAEARAELHADALDHAERDAAGKPRGYLAPRFDRDGEDQPK